MSGAGARSPKTGRLWAPHAIRRATTKMRPHGGDDGAARAPGAVMAEKRRPGGERRTKAAVERSYASGTRSNGVQSPTTIARRIDAIRRLPWPGDVRVLRAHPEPEQLAALYGREDLVGAVVYLDPPYEGCTPYAVDCPRAEVVRLARAYAAAGAHVVISEAIGLADVLGDGWHAVDVTLQGKKGEWVTSNRTPATRFDEQLTLFGAA